MKLINRSLVKWFLVSLIVFSSITSLNACLSPQNSTSTDDYQVKKVNLDTIKSAKAGVKHTKSSSSSDFLLPKSLTKPQLIAQTPYTPKQQYIPADPTNYGQRYAKDYKGKPVDNDWLVVLHETVYSANSAINTFTKANYRDEDQVSYHALIKLDGTIIYLVPPEYRAYGAGNSVFMSARGEETVQTNPQLPPSVNNFAYHVSLETPPDGANSNPYHSGYTEYQYHSLAWLLGHFKISSDRITTHKQVDRSGQRADPRSFERQKFLGLFQSYQKFIQYQADTVAN